MSVNKVNLYVSQLIDDLNEGLTWLKCDDLGYGSIQEKYNVKDQQIAVIRKHPALKNAETSITIFTIIDDTKNETTVHTQEPVHTGSTQDNAGRPVLSVATQTTNVDPVQSDDSFSAFANL